MTTSFHRKPAFQFGLLGLGVFLSRLPFLGPGFGTDPDAWRMAQSARHYATTGEYIVSRFPGYPLSEIVMAALWDGGPIVVNGLTALMSAIAAIFLALILRKVTVEHYIWPTIAFAATPIVFVNSVVAMDYLWATAFILASVYFAMNHRWTAAGVMLGLAVGCRITSAIIGLPLLVFLFVDGRKFTDATRFVVSSIFVALLLWTPVFYTYGFGFLTFYDSPYPDAISITRRMSIDLFGRLGVYALIAVLCGLIVWPRIFKRNRPASNVYPTLWVGFNNDGPSQSVGHQNHVPLLSLLSMAVFVSLFLLLPHEPAYLIPAVPFLIVLLAIYVKPIPLRIACACLILASFVQPCTRAIICKGAVSSSIEQRRMDARHGEQIVTTFRSIEPEAILVCGWWRPMIDVLRTSDIESTRLIYLLDSMQLRTATAAKTPIYYLGDVESFNIERYGIDLKLVGIELVVPTDVE